MSFVIDGSINVFLVLSLGVLFCFRSWCCCAHAPKGFNLAVVLLTWTIFSLLICMTCLTGDQFGFTQPNTEKFFELDSCKNLLSSGSSVLESCLFDNNGRLEDIERIRQHCIKGDCICINSQSCFSYSSEGEEHNLNYND